MKNIVTNPGIDFKTKFTELKKINNLINTDQSISN
jgi:hypothetical protein